MMQQPQNKSKRPTYTNDNVLESIRGIGSAIGKSVSRDVAARIGTDALTSLVGAVPKSGELRPDQPLELNVEKQAAPVARSRNELFRPLLRQEDVQIKQQIDALRAELKALATSVKSLHQEVTRTVTETPVDPGIYHVNFYEQLRSFLFALRQRVDDSRSWLATFNTRRRKIGYWGMYKKHGTQFGLSSERTIATQAG